MIVLFTRCLKNDNLMPLGIRLLGFICLVSYAWNTYCPSSNQFRVRDAFEFLGPFERSTVFVERTEQAPAEAVVAIFGVVANRPSRRISDTGRFAAIGDDFLYTETPSAKWPQNWWPSSFVVLLGYTSRRYLAL